MSWAVGGRRRVGSVKLCSPTSLQWIPSTQDPSSGALLTRSVKPRRPPSNPDIPHTLIFIREVLILIGGNIAQGTVFLNVFTP